MIDIHMELLYNYKYVRFTVGKQRVLSVTEPSLRYSNPANGKRDFYLSM